MIGGPDVGEAPQTAMLLTQSEWEDLAHMVGHYRLCTDWVEYETTPSDDGHVQTLQRRRTLAQRIIDAV